ncbi:DUF167 domain-containing protein [Candidatus Dependentiae bacterium]|nr:DUF167 domain-containing protein [Candidatus Dependentiae bacterium]
MTIILDIKVMPNASKQDVILDKSGKIKCYVRSKPEKGKANEELIKYLSKTLGIKQSDITIVSGHTNPLKKIKIATELNKKELLVKLGIDVQDTFLGK